MANFNHLLGAIVRTTQAMKIAAMVMVTGTTIMIWMEMTVQMIRGKK
jgi:hypothetical protein